MFFASRNDTPSWPSLYSIRLELDVLRNNDPTQPGGHYLSRSSDIFQFTLYWTLVFYTPAFLLCGVYAFFNLTFPPAPREEGPHPLLRTTRGSVIIDGRPTGPYSFDVRDHQRRVGSSLSANKPNKGRSRVTFALLVLIFFLFISLGGAVIGSAIVGYVLAGLYRAGGYHMSTWVPLIWVVVQVLIGLLGLWPSVIDLI